MVASTETTTNTAAETAPPSTTPVDELTLTQVDIGDSQTTDVGDGGDIAEVDGPTVSRRVDGSGLVIAFNSNRSDEESGQSEDRLQQYNCADPLARMVLPDVAKTYPSPSECWSVCLRARKCNSLFSLGPSPAWDTTVLFFAPCLGAGRVPRGRFLLLSACLMHLGMRKHSAIYSGRCVLTYLFFIDKMKATWNSSTKPLYICMEKSICAAVLRGA